MSALSQGIYSTHKFLKHQLFYALVLSSLLAFAFFVGRVYISRTGTHFFLMWNLFLAWIPYLCSLLIAVLYLRRARWWAFVLPAALWLLFFPNAAYLVTDLYNLEELAPVPFWYDIGLFAACAWTGLLLAVASLYTMQLLVKNYFGGALSWIFVFSVVALNGLGIYLGRFMRWNSWDLFVHPFRVLGDTIAPLLHPTSHREPVGVTLMFGALLLVCYITIVSFQQRERN